MVKIKGNVISIKTKRVISNKQKAIMDSMRRPEAYIHNLLGLTKTRLSIPHRSENKEYTDKLNRQKGNVLHFQRRATDNHESTNHVPYLRHNKSMWIGVEIECYIDGAFFGDDCDCGECENCENGDGSSSQLEDLKHDLSSKTGVKNCSVRGDGSLGSGGIEVCFLFDASKGFNKLKRLCKILENHGATVNQDCGLHIHLDQKDLTGNQVVFKGKNFAKFLPLLIQLQPESRRENDYCKPVMSTDDRYSAVNLCSWNKHKTIEIRLHSGTTNFEKIRNWIELWIAIDTQYSTTKLNFSVQTITDLNTFLNLPDSVTEYYTNRHKELNPSMYDSVEENIAV